MQLQTHRQMQRAAAPLFLPPGGGLGTPSVRQAATAGPHLGLAVGSGAACLGAGGRGILLGPSLKPAAMVQGWAARLQAGPRVRSAAGSRYSRLAGELRQVSASNKAVCEAVRQGD